MHQRLDGSHVAAGERTLSASTERSGAPASHNIRRGDLSTYRSRYLLAALAALACVCASASPPERLPNAAEPIRAELEHSKSANRLRRNVRRLLRSKQLRGVDVGIVVADARTGQPLVRVHSDRLYNPASTVKMFTAAAALYLRGANHRFHTDLLLSDDILTVRGTGDPVLDVGSLRQLVDNVTPRLARSDVRHLRVDTSRFDGSDLPPGFRKKRTDSSYRASTGAVALNFGSVLVTVRPGKVGRPPRLQFDPPGRYVIVENTAKTVAGPGSTLKLRLSARGQRSVARLEGQIGSRQRPVSFRRRVERPSLAAGYTLRQLIGLPRHIRPHLGTTPERSRRVARHTSKPLHEILADMNKFSNNFIAEMVLRGLSARDGVPATWDASRQLVRRFLRETVGIRGFEYRNGSGLYDGGKFSPQHVVDLLVFMDRSPQRSAFRNSLAVAGRPGTLEKRLPRHQRRVIGKTGTLNDVSALSGYARSRSGRLLAFSILMNRTNKATARMRNAQDTIAGWLVDMRL